MADRRGTATTGAGFDEKAKVEEILAVIKRASPPSPPPRPGTPVSITKTGDACGAARPEPPPPAWPPWLSFFMNGYGCAILAALWATGDTVVYSTRVAELSRIDEKFSGHKYPESRLLLKVLVALLVVHGIPLDEIAVPDLDRLDDELAVWILLHFDTPSGKGPFTNMDHRCLLYVLNVLLKGVAHDRVFISDAYCLRIEPGGGKHGQCDEGEIAERFEARIRGVGLDPDLVQELYALCQRTVAKEGGLGERPTIFTMGCGAEKLAPGMFAGAVIVKGMRHPQYFLDYPMHVAKLVKLIDKIRSGEYKPGREWCVADALISFTRHDAVAGQLLSILAGETVHYTGAMNLYNGTGEDCEKIQALKEELLGPLGKTAYLMHGRAGCDLAHVFAFLAERDHPVPPHLSREARDEFRRLTSRESVDPAAARRCAFLSHGAGAMDCSCDAPAAGSPGTPSSLKEWYDAIPEDVRAEALKVGCNARHVRVARRHHFEDFDDATFLAEAAEHNYTIALADARGSATRIFPSAAAPREQRPRRARENPVRDAAHASQIEDPSKLAAMPGDVFEAAFAAACNAKVVRFEQSLRAFKRHHPKADLSECTLERVFGTTDVDAINALSEEAYQDAIAKVGLGKAASTAKSDAKRSEQYYAEKEANNGKIPKFKGDPSCPSGFEVPQKAFPRSFRPHLKECSSCRDWAYRVSQLQAAPVGAFPTALTVVKCAAKVQDEQGVKFLGRIDVALFTARRDAAKPKKRRGAKGAAPPAKRSKK